MRSHSLAYNNQAYSYQRSLNIIDMETFSMALAENIPGIFSAEKQKLYDEIAAIITCFKMKSFYGHHRTMPNRPVGNTPVTPLSMDIWMQRTNVGDLQKFWPGT